MKPPNLKPRSLKQNLLHLGSFYNPPKLKPRSLKENLLHLGSFYILGGIMHAGQVLWACKRIERYGGYQLPTKVVVTKTLLSGIFWPIDLLLYIYWRKRN